MSLHIAAARAAALLSAILCFIAFAVPAFAETSGDAQVDTRERTGEAWVNSDVEFTHDASDAKAPSLQDDFHRAVNFGWLTLTPIKEGKSSVNSFSERSDEVEEEIKALLNDTSLTSHEAKITQKFHALLRDWERRNKLGIAPVMPYIERIEAIKDMDALTEYLTDADDPHFGSVLFGVGATPDKRDASNYTVAIATAGLMLGDADEYRAEELSPSAQRRKSANDVYIVKLLKNAGYDESRAKAMNEALFRVEKHLAQNAMGLKKLHSPEARAELYNVRTKEQLSSEASVFPLVAVIDSLGYGDSREFVLMQPKWLESMNSLYCAENLDDIKSYLIIRTLLSTANLLDRKTRVLSIERRNAILGTSGEIPDDTYSYEMTSGWLGEPLGRVWAERHASPETKANIEHLISQVVDYYREMLRGESWLTQATREKAIAKLDELTVRVSYPDKWEDYYALDFRDAINGGTLLEAAAAIDKFELKRDVKLVNTKVDKTKWIAEAQMVNAYYSPSDNSINIPAGILGGVFCPENGKAEWEKILGGIGMVIGHEITHAFDTNGSQYDEHGNFINWWTDEDRAAFKERAKSISDYYSKFNAFHDLPVDGELVLSEAIADLGGLSCMAAIGRSIEGFDFAEFFRSYARVWRCKTTRQAEEYRVKQDVHPLPFMRTNVNVQQLPEFYETFGVKEGDGMYLAPEERISLW